MANESIVLELQILATDKANDISDLLRKALLVATKLGLSDFRQWIEFELNGYRNSADVPAYRKARAQLKLKTPYHGLVPIFFNDQRYADALCDVELRDPIENFQSLVSKPETAGRYLILPLTHEQEIFLLESQSGHGQLPPVRTLSANQVSIVIDAVRTKILEWSLELEAQGILGNGLVFSKEEKEIAVSSPSINIHNFQGVLGNVSDSSVVQNLNMSVDKGDIDELIKRLAEQGIQEKDLMELKEIVTLEPRLTEVGALSERTSNWIGSMVSKALNGTWVVGKSIGVGAASKILSERIMSYYGLK